MLCGLGLELLGGTDLGNQGDMDVYHVAVPDIVPELADRLQKRQYLDVAHRAADLGDDHVQILAIPQTVNAVLDLVGDVGIT